MLLQETKPTRGRARSSWLIAALPAAIAYSLWIGYLAGHAFDVITGVGLVAWPLLAAASFVRAARRRALGVARFWLLIALALVLAAAAGVVLALARLTSGSDSRYVLVANLFHVPAIVLALVAIITSPMTVPGTVGRVRRLSDGAIVATALFMAFWAFGLGSLLASASSPSLVVVAFPIVNAVMVTLVLYMLLAARRERAPVALLGLGLLAITGANTGYASAATHGGQIAAWVIAVWAVGFALLALGAAVAGPGAEPEREAEGIQRHLPYAVAGLAVVVVYAAYLGGRQLDVVLVTSGAATFLLLTGRQWLLTAENHALAQDRERERQALLAQERRALEAERADEAKGRFLAAMSHELRTPLNSIIGFAQLGPRLTPDLDPKTIRYFEVVEASGRQLLRLVNDVLDFSKVNAGRLEIDRETFDCIPVVRECLGQMTPQALEQNVTLHGPTGQLPVFGDQGRLAQVILNLLSNAVKFTPPGGDVEVTAREVDHQVAISVRDSGPGIERDDQVRIFDAFVQVQDGRVRQHPGTGLGLALSRQLMELMDGRISLDSRVGAGSTFTIWMPKPG